MLMTLHFFAFPEMEPMVYSGMIREPIPLDQVLQEKAKRSPSTSFVKFNGKKYSFSDIDALADRFAAFLLGQGVKRGERICILSHNNAFYIAAYFGIIRAGAAVLP